MEKVAAEDEDFAGWIRSWEGWEEGEEGGGSVMHETVSNDGNS